jgi:chromosome segregation ATPase
LKIFFDHQAMEESQADNLLPPEKEILHLKELLVTLKQKYENDLHAHHESSSAKEKKASLLQGQIDVYHLEMEKMKMLHEEELEALKEQQLSLLSMIKCLKEKPKASVSSIDQSAKVQELEALLEMQGQTLKERGELYLNLAEEKDRLEDHILELKEELAAAEVQLKASQQHLAKKVKETAIMNEKMESYSALLGEMERSNEALSLQVNELTARIEQQGASALHLSEALHEREHLAANWEEKYHEMVERWQESEKSIKELKKLEEKHYQMQTILASLGNFIEPEKAAPQSCCIDLQDAPLARHDPFGMKVFSVD